MFNRYEKEILDERRIIPPLHIVRNPDFYNRESKFDKVYYQILIDSDSLAAYFVRAGFYAAGKGLH